MGVSIRCSTNDLTRNVHIEGFDGLISSGWEITKSALQSGVLIAVTLVSLIISMEPICFVDSEPSIDLQLHKRRELYRYGNFKAKFASLSLTADEKCECDKGTRFSITFLTIQSLKRVALEKITGHGDSSLRVRRPWRNYLSCGNFGFFRVRTLDNDGEWMVPQHMPALTR
ncbi:hypothetical protein V1477_006169 [Vespula maculifrons]|uniref:Uncharacterized protein n=1 Tax=Vespula maculifrons TaxID=7453 RepID=A0ABD2CKG6_VESMC